MRAMLVIAGVALVVLLSGCGGRAQKAAPRPATAMLGPSTQLDDLEHPGRTPRLFSLFNAGQGVPRLVLLVSPT